MNQNIKKLGKKIINIALDVLIVVLGLTLLITIYNNIQVNLLGNDYSSFFGHTMFEVQTGSMSDTINAGDWIVVKHVNNIKLNDIVTFEHKGEYVTHRVIEAYKGTYVTKGDANNAKDKPISKDQIVGKVVKVLPGFGILRKTIFNPLVLIALIITLYLVNITFKKTNKDETLKENKLISKLLKVLTTEKEEKEKKAKIEKNTKIKKEEKKEKKSKAKVVKEEKQELKTKKSKTKVAEEIKEEKEVEEVIEEENIEVTENTADLDKTMFFRMLSVDEGEISNAYTNEKIVTPESDDAGLVKKVAKEDKKQKEEKEEDKANSILELIQKRKKKSKNFIEKAIMIKESELNEIIAILNEKNESKPNEPTICETFLNAYIQAKYYNNYSNVETKAKATYLKNEAVIKNVSEKLIKSYKGPDTKYTEKTTKYEKYFLLINQLELDFKLDKNLTEKRDIYNKKLLKYIDYSSLTNQDIKNIINNIIKVQKTYEKALNFFLEKLDTNMFELKFNKITKANYFAVELDHNISFSKVYSDYIVDKTYFEGIVAEDKIEVLASLLSSQLIKDMFSGVFNKKYIVYIPETLYEKQTKLDKIFKMFADDFAKNNISVLVQFEEMAKNKKVIKSLIKEGYNFSVDLNEITLIKKKDIDSLYLSENIFINKQKATKTNILDVVPKEVQEHVIYDDVTTKVGFWGNRE